MAATYEPIATNTIGSATTTITFSSIPSTYTDLVFVISYQATAGGNSLRLKINNQALNIYSGTYLYGDGTASGSTRITAAANYMDINTVSSATNFSNNAIINIMNYSNTITYKTILSRTNTASTGTNASVGLFQDTSAINRLDLTVGTTTFATGSTFTLYGIKAA